jgi:hypothetical protein
MYSSPNGLGFSLPRQLTPPSWLRSLIAQHASAAVKGTTVSIPTSSGTISFDLSDPKQWAAIGNMLKGITISRPSEGGAHPVPVAAAAGMGAGVIALIALGAYMLLARGRKAA